MFRMSMESYTSIDDDGLLHPGPRAQTLFREATIIDIREAAEHEGASAAIAALPNVPRAQWSEIPTRFPQRPLVLCCAAGVRSRRCLAQLGQPPGIYAWTRGIDEAIPRN